MAQVNALIACLFVFTPLVSSQFFNPTAARQQFRVGEIQTIRYNTKFVNYTIAIWQQAMAGGSADLGPAVVRVTNGPQKEFDWQVQLYNFDLEVSNIFFFWMKEGGLENLGSNSVKGMTSAYFNITDEPAPSSSSTMLPATMSSSTTTPSSIISTEISTTDSASSPSATSPKEQDSEAGGGGGGGGGGSLPVAAQAGIGAGVAIVGIVAIVCGVLWFRYLRKQQRILTELQQQTYSRPPDATELWGMQKTPAAARYHYPPAGRYYPHVEMDARNSPAELG